MSVLHVPVIPATQVEVGESLNPGVRAVELIVCHI